MAIDAAFLGALRASFTGEIIEPAHGEYERARLVWNAMIDRRPAAVARPVSVSDVVAAVNAAREHDALLAVRCGAHSGPGHSTCDAGLVLDLSKMNSVRVDPAARTAIVGGGALLGDLDRAAQEHRLATTAGVVAHTGVGGLTLGGGLGRLMRTHGLTIDNLIAVEVVTASGEVVRASDDENPDLFWGLRGAGHNFGVATSFEFRLHPLGPNVLAAMAVYPAEQGVDVVGAYRDWSAGLPEDAISGVQFITVPATMPFPPEIAGMKAVQIISMHTDPEAAHVLEPIAAFGAPAFKLAMPMPYLMLQSMADDHYGWGKRSYVKAGYVRELSDTAVKTALELLTAATGPHAEIDFLQMGGAIARVPEDATAFPGRGAAYYLGFDNMWTDSSDDEREIAWTKDAYSAMEPFMMGGNYVNSLADHEDVSTVRAAYGDAKYERLVDLKTKYDPGNLFRLNQNIKPR